jgi:hypothetical protein
MIQLQELQIILEKIVSSIIGDITKVRFKKFVANSWKTGNFAFCINQIYYSELIKLHSLDKHDELETRPDFHLSHQLPSTSTLLYEKEFSARLVHDSPDPRCTNLKFKEFNIEPHYHGVDSIIIVTSQHTAEAGKYFLHDQRLGFHTIIEIPLTFGSVVCFPRNISHTFKPSDVGLSTLNITEYYIEPCTPGFSYPSLCNFDEAVIMSYTNYQVAFNEQLGINYKSAFD